MNMYKKGLIKNRKLTMSKASNSIDLYSLPSTKLRCFWALDQLERKDKNRFSYTDIAYFLVEQMHIAVTPGSVQKSLERAKGFVDKNKSGFLLMERGRRELLSADSDDTFFIEAGKPFSAKRIQLVKVFSELKGIIKICDPYLDSDTLLTIFRIVSKSTPIKILTKKISDKPAGSIKQTLVELRKEGFDVEVMIYASSELHDRYILDDSCMWLSGNSLNHLGDKESFIVRLGKDVGQSTRALFDNRWRVSKPFI